MKCAHFQLRYAITIFARSPLGSREVPADAIEGVDTPTSSSGSDSSSKAEFKQVKLHAQNQIILSQVLTEEREQVYDDYCWGWGRGGGCSALKQHWRFL